MNIVFFLQLYFYFLRIVNQQKHLQVVVIYNYSCISSAILVDVADVNLDTLLSSVKKKEFTNVKNWVVQHMDNDPSMVMRKIYDSIYGVMKPASIPEAVLIIAKYMRDIAIVPDQEVNMLACLTEIMMSCEFK